MFVLSQQRVSREQLAQNHPPLRSASDISRVLQHQNQLKVLHYLEAYLSRTFMAPPPPGFGPTTQQRVLEIPEILELVFCFLDDKSNTNNVTVCKRWSELALNIIWREVSDVQRLFGLLAPMQLLPPLPRDRDCMDYYVRRPCLHSIRVLISSRCSRERWT